MRWSCGASRSVVRHSSRGGLRLEIAFESIIFARHLEIEAHHPLEQPRVQDGAVAMVFVVAAVARVAVVLQCDGDHVVHHLRACDRLD